MKNTPTSASAASINNAALNALALLNPQHYATPFPQKAPHKPRDCAPVRNVEEVVELVVGTDPQVLVRRAVNLVQNTKLRDFIRSVMAERDVNRVLTLLCDGSPKLQRLPIDRLRAVAQAGSKRAFAGPRKQDTLYVAILVAGIEVLLGKTVQAPYSSRDVIRSVARDAMRKLANHDEALASDLRNCLGWGNDDEMVDVTVQCLQQRVLMAVVDLRSRLSLPQMKSQH